MKLIRKAINIKKIHPDHICLGCVLYQNEKLRNELIGKRSTCLSYAPDGRSCLVNMDEIEKNESYIWVRPLEVNKNITIL